MTDLEKETKRLKRLIRSGELPKRMFVKGANERLERAPNRFGKKKLTWKTKDTLKELLTPTSKAIE